MGPLQWMGAVRMRSETADKTYFSPVSDEITFSVEKTVKQPDVFSLINVNWLIVIVWIVFLLIGGFVFNY